MEEVQHRGVNIFFIVFPLLWGTYFGYLFWNDINRSLQQNNQQPVAAIAQSAKNVQRQYANRNLWEAVSEGLSLYSGDKIRTGPGAAVRISIATGDVIDLGPDSLIALSFNKEGEGVISLENGTLVSVVSSGHLSMQSSDGAAKPIAPGSSYGGTGEIAPTASASPFDEVLPASPPLQVVIVPPEPPPVVEEPAPEQPAPIITRLPAPVNLFPFANSVIGSRDLAGFQGMRFSWNTVPEAASYLWTLGTSNGVVLRRAVVNSPLYIIPDMALFMENQSFVWTVQAQRNAPYNDETAISPVSESTFRVYIPARLPVPTDLFPANNSVIGRTELASLQGVRFSWSEVPEAASYIWTLGKSNGAVLRRASVRATTYFMSDVSLFVDNQDFVWTVQAQRAPPYNDEDTTSPAAESAFRVYIPARLPGPTDLSPANGSVIGKTELASLQGVRFSWSAVPGASSYTWILGKANGAVLRRATVTTTSYLVPDVSLFTANQDFVWTVQAQRAEDQETSSPVVESAFRVYVPNRLDMPLNLSPANNSVISKTELASLQGVNFSWDPVPEAASYIWTLKTVTGEFLRRATIINTSFMVLDTALFIANQDLIWTVQARRDIPYTDETLSPAAENILHISLPRIEAPVPLEPVKL